MARAGNFKRSIGLALVMAVAGGALFVATPSSAERTMRQVKDARPAAPKAIVRVRPSAQSLGSSSFGNANSSRARADGPMARSTTTPVNDEPNLEPWSLIAGALAVMAFLARHRRAD